MRITRYNLSYSVDNCQHTKPAPSTAGVQWGHCFHYEGKPKPSNLVKGNAKVEVQVSGGLVMLTAIGFPETDNLDAVYRVKGAMLP